MIRLEARALSLSVDGRDLCRDLSVAFSTGEHWAILGANGSGKTSLLLALAGLRAVDRGEVLLDGRPLHEYSARARAKRRAVLFQDSDAGFPASVREIALSGRYPHIPTWGMETAADVAAVATALAAVDLEPLAARPVNSLSGGERRRAEIAALLAQDAPVCLLDEPTHHLDLRYQLAVMARFREHSRGPGKLSLSVLHDLNLATRFCSHGLLLFPGGGHCHGPLVEILSVETLKRTYGCDFEQLGDSAHPLFLPR